ncbi:DAPG hydrolase family protein [Archaeoglobus fulgidus]|uniref:DAPG hydrolase family protein n=1 Tax=Archaeoglobus fulgidus TaxID=2234 RepID=UPI000B34C67D|nr:hypothetical protein [Archaeoglobus fulgidus]
MKKSAYEKYLIKPLTPLPWEHRLILEKGEDIPLEGVLSFSEKDKMLDEGYLPYENGFHHFPDGRAYVACLTKMPKVSAEMIYWWFRWHSEEAIRYQIWYPGKHFDVRTDETGSTHYVTEDVGTGKQRIVIRFMTPAEFGFSKEKLETIDLKRNAIICARVGAEIPGHVVWHTWMCHYAREAEKGVELRSRFWIGEEIEVSGPLALILARLLNRQAVKRRMIPGNIGRHMFHHCAQEYHHLAEILPEVYEEFGGMS